MNLVDVKLPPHDLEAEQAVLGAAMMGGLTVVAGLLEEGLRREDFYREQHGLVYGALLRMHAEQEPLDALTLRDRLRREGGLEKVGGQGGLEAMHGAVQVLGNYRTYARVLVRLSCWRERRRLLLWLLDDDGPVARESEQEFRAGMRTLRAVELHFRGILERTEVAP